MNENYFIEMLSCTGMPVFKLFFIINSLDETDSILLKEGTALAAERIWVKYSMLSQPSHVKIGEAYDGYH